MNPIEAKYGNRLGERKNHKCPYYRACLGIAANERWAQFACHECEHEDKTVDLDVMNYAKEGEPEIIHDQSAEELKIARAFARIA